MPEYLSPGVYVEEVDAGPKPIEGVSTSTAGAVGVTVRGPTSEKPILVTSFADFQRIFGGFHADPDNATINKWTDPDSGGRWWQFPLSVKGFFDNGGQRIFIKRAVSSTAVASSINTGKGLVSAVLKDASKDSNELKLQHLINIDKNSTIKLFRGSDNQEIGAGFGISAYSSGSGSVTLDTNLPEDLLAQRGDFVEIHSRSTSPVPPNEVTLSFSAKSSGKWGDGTSLRVSAMVGSTLNITHDPAIPGDAVTSSIVSTNNNTVEVDDVTGLSNDDHVLIQGGEYTISNVDGGANTFDVSPLIPSSQTWAAGTSVKRLRPANVGGGGKTVNVWGAARLYTGALVELDNTNQKETHVVDSVSGDTVTLVSTIQNTYLESHKFRVIEAEVSVRYQNADGVIEADETFSGLRLVDDGSSYLVSHINERSSLVDVTIGAGGGFSSTDLSKFPTTTSGAWTNLASGDDMLADLSVDDFVGEDKGSGNRTGIQAMEDIDEISLCLVPGIWATTVQNALIQHCEILKDRFAIIDPQDNLSLQDIQDRREALDTKYAAIYYPWLTTRDPFLKKSVAVAPSGHMVGIYARVDVERGVHKAPANETIRGIEGLAQSVTKREQDLLNPKNINALRFFPNRGNRVWGARVLTSDSAWKYINVRRLFIFVEESIDEGTQWVVFEPNDEPLWARVRQTINNFLTTVWRSGALQGQTADEAFFVKCDRTTMTQDDIDNGRLICVIGIAAVKPAEFVIFRIQQKTIGAETT